jgi:alkylated DNA repair dioxygenase AlkB
MLEVQPSLFGSVAADEDGVRAPAPLVDVHRVELGRGAWVDLRPGWIDPNDRLFERLLKRVPWRAERRTMYDRVVDVPRLACFYREGVKLPDPVLTQIRERLNEYYRDELGEDLVTAGMCLYRDGDDSVAWHGDRIGRGATHDTMVAIVSLGASRTLLLRPTHGRHPGQGVADGGGGVSRRFALGHGDLLVMGGSCQRTWEHAVPKTRKKTGPRMSIQYRVAGVA